MSKERNWFSEADFEEFNKNPTEKTKYKIKEEAITQYNLDKKEIDKGTLKPKYDFQFIWNKDTGKRQLFRGPIDPIK